MPKKVDKVLEPQAVVDLLQKRLLGSAPKLTGREIAERVGIPFEVARERWRSLGFTALPEDEKFFTKADLHAMELTEKLITLGLLAPGEEAALVRALGRSFARLAEWQLGTVANVLDMENLTLEDVGAIADEIVPAIEDLQNYIWRRHTLSVATRMLLAPTSEDSDSVVAVGFADIVGYTKRSRELEIDELARLVDGFEAGALSIVVNHGGKIIKTIGDEILFVVDNPRSAAEIGLELTEMHLVDPELPELRVGMAYGPVLAMVGDVFGEVVNIASRLTSAARPGRVLVDKALAEAIADDEEFKLRKTRRTSVKGYRHLEQWALRRPSDDGSGLLPVPAPKFIQERAQNLLRIGDEKEPVGEGTAGTEGLE